MDLKKNFKCCLVSPVCHFVAITVGFLAMVQTIHLHAHKTMEVDADSYVRNFCRKNTELCQSFVDDY
jgi:hypothetical protein